VQVYVAGISRSTTSEELKEFFEAHGAILDINMKGHYAFITFELPKAAAAAVQALHGKTFRNNKLTVEKTSKFNTPK
jgi:RNA recognition motif-containing protein